MRRPFGFDSLQQSFATVLEQVDNQFEPFVSLVIRVGNVSPVGVPAGELDHAVDVPGRFA